MACISEMQEWFNIHKSIHIINHINRMKKKNYMTVSRDAEKAFDNLQHFMIKKKKQHGKLDAEGTFLQIIRAIYDKSTANIIMHGES